MKEVILEAELREVSTRHALKDIRTRGMIPAVFYGHHEKAVTMAVNAKKFAELLQAGGSNILVNLKIDSATKTAIIKEIQRDVITYQPLHIDFQAISLKEKIEVSVPVHVMGVAPGVKLAGGVMEHLLRELRVKCLPTDIPASFDVDVSNLNINQSISVKDLPQREGVEILTDPSSIILNVVAPMLFEEAPAPGTEAAAAATAAAEPEVISKGKKEEEGEGAAEKKAEQPKAGEKGEKK